MLKKLFSLFLFFNIALCGATGFHDQLSYNVGMVSMSLTENQSSIKQTDTTVTATESETTASAAAVAAMSFQLSWEFKNKGKLAYFTKATVPLMNADGSGVFLGDVGVNVYLNPMGAKYTLIQNGTTVVIIPKFKYYWGGVGGVGYVVYNTESAKKSDVFFNLGLHGGMVYSLGDKWGLKGELGASRTTGVVTTGIKIDFFFGATYYL